MTADRGTTADCGPPTAAPLNVGGQRSAVGGRPAVGRRWS